MLADLHSSLLYSIDVLQLVHDFAVLPYLRWLVALGLVNLRLVDARHAVIVPIFFFPLFRF